MISDAPGGKCPGERKHLASFPGLPRRREDFLREKTWHEINADPLGLHEDP